MYDDVKKNNNQEERMRNMSGRPQVVHRSVPGKVDAAKADDLSHMDDVQRRYDNMSMLYVGNRQSNLAKKESQSAAASVLNYYTTAPSSIMDIVNASDEEDGTPGSSPRISPTSRQPIQPRH